MLGWDQRSAGPPSLECRKLVGRRSRSSLVPPYDSNNFSTSPRRARGFRVAKVNTNRLLGGRCGPRQQRSRATQLPKLLKKKRVFVVSLRNLERFQKTGLHSNAQFYYPRAAYSEFCARMRPNPHGNQVLQHAHERHRNLPAG